MKKKTNIIVITADSLDKLRELQFPYNHDHVERSWIGHKADIPDIYKEYIKDTSDKWYGIIEESIPNPDDFSYHELLDRSATMSQIFETIIVKHPLVNHHKKVEDKVDEIGKALAELYQIADELSFKYTTDRNKINK
jgi:hypothetical protein